MPMSKASKPSEPSNSSTLLRPEYQTLAPFVRGLVQIIAPELVPLLDSRGAQRNRSFISDALREREYVLLNKEELLIYILIEHQSTVDRVKIVSKILSRFSTHVSQMLTLTL